MSTANHDTSKPTPDAELLRRYLSATSAMGPHWHPGGSAFTFVCNDPGSFQVYVAELGDADKPHVTAATQPSHGRHGPQPTHVPGGADVSQVTHTRDRCTDPRFLSTGEIIYTSDTGGDENFRLRLATREHDEWRTRRLTTNKLAKHRIVSLQPEELLFVANDRDKAVFELYAQPVPVDPWNPELLFTPERGIVETAARLGDGSLLVVLAYSNMSQELVIARPEYQSLTAGLAGKRDVRWELIREGHDGELLVATDLDSDRLRPAILTLDGELREIPAMETTGEYASGTYREGAPETYIETNREGYSTLFRLEELAATTVATPLPLAVHGTLAAGDARTSRVGMAISPDGKRIATAASGPTEVTNIWVAPVSRGVNGGATTTSWRRITEAAIPGVERNALSEATLARFESFDGESIPYFTHLPPGDKPRGDGPRGDRPERGGPGDGDQAGSPAVPAAGYPAVFMIHGGPEAQARPAFNNIVQFLTAAGFAVIVPNIRGSAGYGRRYLDLDNREKRLDSIRDIAELAKHVAGTPAIDGSRLAIAGGSYGGFAVLSALTEYPDLWKAGIDIVGISNFVTFLENTAAWRRPLREAEYGSLDDRELLERISPINRIERITAPLLIIQGDNDERVPLSESIQMYERLRDLGRTVELMRFADEGHGVTRLENRIVAYTRVVEWLREFV